MDQNLIKSKIIKLVEIYNIAVYLNMIKYWLYLIKLIFKDFYTFLQHYHNLFIILVI